MLSYENQNIIINFIQIGKRLLGVANVATFTFDVSALGNHETILQAELRIPFSRGCPPHAPRLYGGGDCRLEGVLEGECQYSLAAGTSPAFRRRFTVLPNNVRSFDLTDLVNNWRGRGGSGCVTLMITEKGSGLRGHDKRKLTSSVMKTLLAPPHNPAIVIHTRDTSPEESEGMFLLPSNMEQLYTHGVSKRQAVPASVRYRPPVTCSLVRHYVDFKRIGLEGRIIAPRGVNVNFCSGRCTFPLATNRNRTIHAELQALLHLLDNQSVPQVCCSPMRYQSTVLLYYTPNKTLSLKRFNKISVRKCGCT